jgi:hypothetical protein
MKIIVTKRATDYHAKLEGHPEIWATGRTSAEAVGNLITRHGKRLEIEISHCDSPNKK